MLASWTSRVIAALAVALIVAGFLYLQSCEDRRNMGAQQKLDRGQAGAASNSSKDAVTTQGQVNANEQAGADLGRANEKEIRGAAGSNQVAPADATRAGLSSLCRRAAYRNSERCRPK